MYFANMYCYGSAQDNKVGITGIRGCMGIVYVGHGLYAVHIPPASDAEQKSGRVAFEAYVKNNEQAVGNGGYLFAFVNGKNRTDAVDEMKDMKKRLNSPSTTIYRIMKHLGPDSGGLQADSVAILVDRFHGTTGNPAGCSIWYKRNDQITWVSGGTREAGQYKLSARYQGDEVPSELSAHWWHMDEANCTVTKV